MVVARVGAVIPRSAPPSTPEITSERTLDDTAERQNLERASEGGRISAAEALFLLEHGALELIGDVADTIRRRRFPHDYATYIIDRNINYTNVCVVKCSFCAFYRLPGSPEGYRRSQEEIFQRVQEAVDQGATQILFQGGHDPKLTITYYEDLLSSVKARYPV
ncbi:MAG: radical SAM protein, partial [Chloroflexota bacterium]|nr:radical SAM protein [Chloroflexota bacterium]